jgi:hypothetical protein
MIKNIGISTGELGFCVNFDRLGGEPITQIINAADVVIGRFKEACGDCGLQCSVEGGFTTASVEVSCDSTSADTCRFSFELVVQVGHALNSAVIKQPLTE